ncbi:PH domain-containing protein [Parapedobacter defluvii]|uniref:PH domain-containing protein n=1 Tax=Parapedobacter defluvii TaxID=2045106 RepID=UPI00166BEEF2
MPRCVNHLRWSVIQAKENTPYVDPEIEETRNPISAPAPSLYRLEIFYNRFYSIAISPKDKPEFIANLIKLNPEIEVV